MKRLFILACSTALFSGCTSSRDYSSISEPVQGPRPLDPIVSTPRNWNKPVKTAHVGRVEENDGTRSVPGTGWDRTWHDQ